MMIHSKCNPPPNSNAKFVLSSHEKKNKKKARSKKGLHNSAGIIDYSKGMGPLLIVKEKDQNEVIVSKVAGFKHAMPHYF